MTALRAIRRHLGWKLFVSYLLSCWHLQITRGHEYAVLAENNRLRRIPVPPTRGAILFEGRDVTRVPAHARVGLGMGRTFQITEIFPELTALRSIASRARVSSDF